MHSKKGLKSGSEQLHDLDLCDFESDSLTVDWRLIRLVIH